MIKTVFFDIGNVLIYFSPDKMLSQLALCTGLEPQAVKGHFYDTPLRERYEKGSLATEELFSLFQKKAEKPFTLPDFEAAFSNIFTPNTELFPVVETLKKANVQLILLSNTSPCHFQHLNANYPIFRLFDDRILSYEVGAWKPEKKIYEKALLKAKTPPEECFYIDDIPEFIEGAKRAGLPGALFTTVKALKQDFAKKGLIV